MDKNNRIDLSQYNKKPKTEEEPIHFEPTFLSQLFRESDDPIQRKKDRDARFGRTSSDTISSTFTK